MDTFFRAMELASYVSQTVAALTLLYRVGAAEHRRGAARNSATRKAAAH